MRIPLRPFPLMAGVSLLLLAACSQPPTPTAGNTAPLPADSPYTNGAQYPWSDRLEETAADPYTDGLQYGWASPTATSGLNTQAFNGGQNFLSDLQWTSATNGWGPVERDRSNGQQGQKDGTTLKVGGRSFAKGLGVHAASEIKYALGGQCNTFTAFVGIDEEVQGLGSAQFKVFGDDKLLFDSGVRRGRDLSLPVDVRVDGVKELRLVVPDGGDNNFYDHADWGEAAVYCAAAQPDGDVFLSDLPYVSATNGYGPVEFGRSNGEQAQFDGKPLTVGGQVFGKGLGMHASSNVSAELNYDLGGACTTLTASIGIDDEVGDRGSVVFQVYGDGKKLFDSGVVRGSDAARSMTVDVTNVQALRLAVTDAGDTMNYDHADWADARLKCGPATVGQPGTLDPSFGTGGQVAAGGVDSVLEPGGSLVVVGADLSLKRLSPGGAVVQSAPGGQAAGAQVKALARQPDGKLVAVGQRNNEAFVARFNSDLTLDNGFGQGGLLSLKLSSEAPSNVDTPTSTANDVTVQSDGRIVLVGSAYHVRAPSDYPLTALDFVVVRLTASGQRDATFGDGGVVYTNASPYFQNPSHTNAFDGVALQADGKIVAVGTAIPGPTNDRGMVIRYLPDGRLDPAFSDDGVAPADRQSQFHAVVLYPDGRILAGGETLLRYDKGFLQLFNTNGGSAAATEFLYTGEFDPNGPYSYVRALAQQSDGKVLVGGYNDIGVVARFTANLTRDANYPTVILPSSFDGVRSIWVDTQDRALATTTQTTARLFP